MSPLPGRGDQRRIGAPTRRRKLAGQPLDVLGAIAGGGVIGAEARYGLGLAWPHGPADGRGPLC